MKDSMNDLFRERFQGHEVPVDPAAWQVIEARLLTSAPAADHVNDLFRERFQGHEVSVDPAVWTGISTQLGHVATTGGLLGGFGWVAALVVGTVVTGGLVIALSGNGSNSDKPVAAAAVKNPVQALPKTENTAALRATTLSAPAAVAPSTATPRVDGIPARGGQNRSELVIPAASTPSVAEQSMAATPVAPAGTEVVDHIISNLTEQVELEVRSTYREPSGKPPVEPVSGSIVEIEEPAVEEPVRTANKPFMPNTFTPNNDGINDLYIVPLEGYTSMLLRIYSIKSNQLVFSTNTGEPWNGANCEDGMYLVAVEAMTADGQLVSEGKVVWLNRTGMN